MDVSPLRVVGSPDTQVNDHVEQGAIDKLMRFGIWPESNAGRVFRCLYRKSINEPGPVTIERNALTVESGATSTDGMRDGLKRLYKAKLLKKGICRRQGPIVLHVLPGTPDDPQQLLPTFEPPPGAEVLPAVKLPAARHLPKEKPRSTTPESDSGEQPRSVTPESDYGVVNYSADAVALQALLQQRRAEAAQAVATCARASAHKQATAVGERHGTEDARSRSKSSNTSKDLDLDLATEAEKAAQLKTRIAKKAGQRNLRIDELQALLPGLYRSVCGRIVRDIEKGVYTTEDVSRAIDNGLEAVRLKKVPKLWMYVEGAMRNKASENKRPWSPRRARR